MSVSIFKAHFHFLIENHQNLPSISKEQTILIFIIKGLWMTGILPSNQILSVKALLALFVWNQISGLSLSMDFVTSSTYQPFTVPSGQLFIQMLWCCNTRSTFISILLVFALTFQFDISNTPLEFSDEHLRLSLQPFLIIALKI